MDRYAISRLTSKTDDYRFAQQGSVIKQTPPEGVVLVAVRARDMDVVLAHMRHMLPEGCVLYAHHETAAAPEHSLAHGLSMLTGRQRDILRLLMRNLSNKEIGRRLALSHFTVRNHVSQLLKLLKVRSRKEAVAMLNDAMASDAHIFPLSD